MSKKQAKPRAAKSAEALAGTNAAPVSSAPFRLIVHIGAGKTGTSSIQYTLRHAQPAARTAGTWYFGQNLEFAPVNRFRWQKPGGIQHFLKLGRKDANAEAHEVLEQSIAQAKAAGATQAIWSNEWFFRRGSYVVDALAQLADSGIDVRIIAYVRRHDAWARSSYVQWGLKDKTNKGPLQSFEAYCSRRPTTFADDLANWYEVFDGKMMLRNMDAVGDSVADFLKVTGLDQAGISVKRQNESPPPEDLALRSVFNSQFDDKVSPAEFTAAMGSRTVPVDASLDDWLAGLLPSADQLAAIVEASAADRARLDAWLAASGQPPIDTAPLPPKPLHADAGKVTAALTHIVMRQALRLQALEDKIETLAAPPAPAQVWRRALRPPP